MLFAPSNVDGIDVNQLIEKAPVMALVDERTRNPIIVKSGGVEELFEYGQAPRHLALPKDLADEIVEGAREIQAHNVPAPRPY